MRMQTVSETQKEQRLSCEGVTAFIYIRKSVSEEKQKSKKADSYSAKMVLCFFTV